MGMKHMSNTCGGVLLIVYGRGFGALRDVGT